MSHPPQPHHHPHQQAHLQPHPQAAPPPTAAPPRRAFAPDLARGFMLCLIGIANVSAYLWGTSSADSLTGHPPSDSALDIVLSVLTILFVDGSIYPMFAFLFGYGIVQFARNRTAAGDSPQSITRMLLRRHLWLVIFGFVHAALLFGGDILGAYGLCGLALGYLIVNARDRILTITVWVLTGVLVLFVLVQIGFVALALALGGGTGTEVAAESDGEDVVAANAILGSLLTQGADEPNYLLAAGIRLLVWVMATVLAMLALTVPITIILGGLAARHWWIEPRPTDSGTAPNAEAVRRLRLGLVAAIGIPVGVLGALPRALAYLGWVPEDAAFVQLFGGLGSLTGAFAGIGYAALFGLIGLRVQNRPPRLLLPVAYLGKRSLSFYLLQSVIFAPLLTAWGFGLGGAWNTTPAFLLAIGVWLVSLGLATWLERKNAKGPAEVVLRRLTYGR